MTIARIFVVGLLLALYTLLTIAMVLPELLVITMFVKAVFGA